MTLLLHYVIYRFYRNLVCRQFVQMEVNTTKTSKNELRALQQNYHDLALLLARYLLENGSSDTLRELARASLLRQLRNQELVLLQLEQQLSHYSPSSAPVTLQNDRDMVKARIREIQHALDVLADSPQ